MKSMQQLRRRFAAAVKRDRKLKAELQFVKDAVTRMEKCLGLAVLDR
jgi:hypothetical protein